ncbi:MAG: hypothetical protein RI995_1705 [Bacteroidota bacterium]|jgi:hypothetical protein
MSEYYKPVHRPRKKLKMPLFGNIGSGGSKNTHSESIWGTKNFSTMIFVMGALALLAQFYLPDLWAEKVYADYDELKELALDGAIRKKYTDASNPNEVHYLLLIKQKDGSRRKLDLYQADSVFFDQVAVPQRLFKKSGEMEVRVTRFSKPDTVMRLLVK